MSVRKTKKREQQESLLAGALIERCTIECDTGCFRTDVADMDASDAVEYFYKKGWRCDSNGYSICPKCARKK